MNYDDIFTNADDNGIKPQIRKIKYVSESRKNISIITYNILKPYQIYNKKYKNEQKEATILWFYRWEIIKRELSVYNADIICLQEVQWNIYQNDMLPFFSQYKYSGNFVAAEPIKTQEQRDKLLYYNDSMKSGVAIFYKNYFCPIQISSYDFYKNAKKKQTKEFAKRLKNYFVNLCIILEDTTTNKRILVSTLHIVNKEELNDVKLLMIEHIINHVKKLATKKMPIVLTGDYNSLPSSDVYKLVTKEFESVYSYVFGREPKYTNYTEKFKDTIDYIFVNNNVNIIGALEEPNIDHKIRIPDPEYPSDHILQMACLFYKH